MEAFGETSARKSQPMSLVKQRVQSLQQKEATYRKPPPPRRKLAKFTEEQVGVLSTDDRSAADNESLQAIIEPYDETKAGVGDVSAPSFHTLASALSGEVSEDPRSAHAANSKDSRRAMATPREFVAEVLTPAYAPSEVAPAALSAAAPAGVLAAASLALNYGKSEGKGKPAPPVGKMLKDMERDLLAAFDEKLAALRHEQADRSDAAQKREVELTQILEEKEKELREVRASSEAQSRQLSCVQAELDNCRESLQAKTKLADDNAKERDCVQARYETLAEQHGATENQQMQTITELKLKMGNLSSEVESTKLEMRSKELSDADQAARMLALQRRLLKEEKGRRDQHNAIQELKGNIRVIMRTRPALQIGACAAVRVSEGAGKMSVQNGGDTHTFEFDNVFGCDCTQQRLYGEVEGLVQSALDGYKVCIFAYGQTGSGKTFTMKGSKGADTEGIVPRALTQIFQSTEDLKAKGWTWTLEASFLEVYQEQIYDLLFEGAAAESEPAHKIQDDEAFGSKVSNLTVVNVDSKAAIQRLMAKADKHRKVGETDMNAKSSRSHAVFALYLKGKNAKEELTGALHLVDLAGSERLSKSKATGVRLKETCAINKSLSCLTGVFAAKQEEAAGQRDHIPFRNSRLTHLLEPCLSGNGKTLMVANVAPEESHAQETVCSLRFASQVGLCNTGGKPRRNVKILSETASRAPTPTSRAGSRAATPTGSRPATSTSSSSSQMAAPAEAAATARSRFAK